MSDLTVKEFADKLGVSLPTVWRLIKIQEINAYKVLRCVRIPSEEYHRYVQKNLIGSIPLSEDKS